MPKADTWPCGSTMETRTGMDSAGSCDSVVSRNSGFSDDSLEHLSAEEKACLMFLEETIESLDTGEDSGLSIESLDTGEEDSGQSNDEPDRLPAPGNVASKTAHLSASMDNSRLHNASKHPCKQPIREVGRPAFGCLVPTPLVLANGSSGLLLPKSRAGPAPDKENSCPGPRLSPSDPRSRQAPPPPRGVPSEVNVVVIPPPAKPRDPPGCWGGSEGGAVCPRAPLTHEALVQLRKSASMKRVPDSPPAPGGPPKAHPWTRQPRGPSAAWPQDTLPHREPGGYSPSPPVVAPKPKRTPSDVSAASYPPLASSPGDRPLPDPQRARREALQKLGLLRENGPSEPWPSSAASPPLGPSEPHPHWEASPPRGGPPLQEDDPPLSNPGGGRPFCYTRAPQSSGGALRLHHGRHGDERSTTLTTPPSRPLRPDGAKAATLERSGVGLGSLAAEQAATPSSSPQPRSASLGGGQRGGGYDPMAPGAASSPASLAQTAPQKQAAAAGFGVAAAPSMGPDRREALRKLGLLKD